MLRYLWIALALLLTACAPATKPQPETLRLLSYNIHRGQGMDGKFDLERIAAVILAANPDFVALQEVDVGTKRSSGVDQATELARLTKMHVVFGEAMPFQGGQYGDAVLSRKKPIVSGSIALPAAKDREPRVAAFATLKLSRGSFTFVGTHFDHMSDDKDRVWQATTLIEHWPRNSGDDVVLAGDFNAIPQSRPMEIILEHFDDASASNPQMTFYSVKPIKRIDWILYRPEKGWRVLESRVIDEKMASDHLPLLVVLEREGK